MRKSSNNFFEVKYRELKSQRVFLTTQKLLRAGENVREKAQLKEETERSSDNRIWSPRFIKESVIVVCDEEHILIGTLSQPIYSLVNLHMLREAANIHQSIFSQKVMET